MEKAVTNATVLIFLAKIGKLEFLNIFSSLYTTSAIHSEVLGAKDTPEKERKDLEEYFQRRIQIENPSKILSLDLDAGETTALSLCTEKKILFFLSDDKKARKQAEILGVSCLGTLGILLFHVQQKKITKQQAKEFLHLLLSHSFYMDTELYARMLELLEESKR